LKCNLRAVALDVDVDVASSVDRRKRDRQAANRPTNQSQRILALVS